eukprot:scaffold247_cov172-Ochromonas_danica.AAC.27
MIRGVIKVGSSGETDNCTMAAFSECTHLYCQAINSAYFLDERIKHMYDDSLQVGIVLGSHGRRSVFLSHLCCSGESCQCAQLALPWLSAENENKSFDSESIQDAVDILKNGSVKFPLIAFLISDGAAVLLSYLSHNSVKVEVLSRGVYSIKDCFVTQLEGEETELEHILACYPSRLDFLRLSSQLIDCLYDQMMLWPKPGGLGVVYSNRSGETRVRVAAPSTLVKGGSNNDNGKKRPKGPITAFNFFAMMARTAALQECNDNISNNELNTVLGQKWKMMSSDQKAPYVVLAESDRIRYEQEKKEFRDGDESDSDLSDGKSMTAYNHFVHQERQFILGLNLNDAQTRMGRHAGDRWNAMEDAEKNLYLTLNYVADSRYKKSA